jgi:hypothetical protein
MCYTEKDPDFVSVTNRLSRGEIDEIQDWQDNINDDDLEHIFQVCDSHSDTKRRI